MLSSKLCENFFNLKALSLDWLGRSLTAAIYKALLYFLITFIYYDLLIHIFLPCL